MFNNPKARAAAFSKMKKPQGQAMRLMAPPMIQKGAMPQQMMAQGQMPQQQPDDDMDDILPQKKKKSKLSQVLG